MSERRELLKRVAAELGLQVVDVERVVDRVSAGIVEITAAGGRVSLPLGVFRVRERSARIVVAPDGSVHHIEPQAVLTFRAAKAVRVVRRGS